MNIALITQILVLGLDDWIRLAEIASAVRTHSPLDDPHEVPQKTLEVIEDLMKLGCVKVGELLGNGAAIQFREWGMDIPSTLKELQKRWLDYGGPIHPELGNDVCWLMNTPKGDELAKATTKHKSPD